MKAADSWIDGLSEGVVLVQDAVVVRINAAAAEILGADPLWAQGKRLITVLRDHRLERALSSGEPAEVRLSGRVVEAVPIPGGLALRDLTELRRAREEAEVLLATLSHELRTPMTTVRSTLEALEAGDMEPATRTRLLERAVAEAERVVRLLGDLTTDVAPPRERSVYVSEVLARARQILAPTLEERGVQLEDSTLGHTAWADPDKLLQVLLNLIENAALHGPRNAQVTVRAETQAGWVRLTVRDQGHPLAADAEVLAPLQLPGRSPRSREHGLGLFIVRSIAEGWGGKAWWQEAEKGGNEFGVLVPGSRDATRSPPLP